MKLPCETAVWYALPKIRADLAKELLDTGMTQKEVAEKLGITPAAVSQYRHKKRGKKVKMPGDYKERIRKAAGEIKDSENDEAIKKIICACCVRSRDKLV